MNEVFSVNAALHGLPSWASLAAHIRRKNLVLRPGIKTTCRRADT
jgi:hypothetical protein